MRTRARQFSRTNQSGLSLIEVVIFMIIISVGVTALVKVMGNMVQYSADPMLQKQALVIAESLLEEITLQPFTYCDPNDPVYQGATMPTSSANCTGGATGATAVYSIDRMPLGAQTTAAGKTRYSVTNPFNNVADYATLGTMTQIRSIDDQVIAELSGYTAIVNIIHAGTEVGLAQDTDALKIEVTVRTPKYSVANDDYVTLSAYRFRYAPNATP